MPLGGLDNLVLFLPRFRGFSVTIDMEVRLESESDSSWSESFSGRSRFEASTAGDREAAAAAAVAAATAVLIALGILILKGDFPEPWTTGRGGSGFEEAGTGGRGDRDLGLDGSAAAARRGRSFFIIVELASIESRSPRKGTRGSERPSREARVTRLEVGNISSTNPTFVDGDGRGEERALDRVTRMAPLSETPLELPFSEGIWDTLLNDREGVKPDTNNGFEGLTGRSFV